MNTPYLVPYPQEVFRELSAKPAAYLVAACHTAGESAAGLLLGVVGASILVLIIFFIPRAEEYIMPLAISLKATPIVAVAPLIAVWLGPGWLSKVVMASLISFFPILQNLNDGLRELPSGTANYLKVLGTSKYRALRLVRIWYATRSFASALKIASPLAVVGAIVSEFIQATKGLGPVLVRSIPATDTSAIVAAVLCVATIGLSMYGLALIFERWMLALAHLERETHPANG